jgi:AcrR family transcriptional regulator
MSSIAASTQIDAPEPFSQGDEKARQILEGAKQVFLAEGFDGASVNDIARAARVSKGTIYSHFESKEALFEALIRAERRQQAEQVCQLDEADPDLAAVMFNFGRSLLTMMVRPDVIALMRTVMAVAQKFPRIGRAFYEAGPKYGLDRLAVYLKTLSDAGKLETPDPRMAASHFLQLCLADIFKQKMFCAIDEMSAAEIDETIKAAVDVFMKAYGPRQ